MSYSTETDFTYAPSLQDDDGAAPPPPYSYHNHSAADAAPPQAAAPGLAPWYEAVPETSTTNTSSSIVGARNRFPQALNGYYEKKWTTRNIQLGEHANSPLYNVALGSDYTGKLDLCAGASSSAGPVIATAAFTSKWGSAKETIVELLALGDDAAGSSYSGGGGTGSTRVVMKMKVGLLHVSYRFSVQTGTGKDLRTEDFEWRQSRGEEVRGLNKHAGYGWKLVRLSGNNAEQGGGGGGSDRTKRAVGWTSDGQEVVAAWSHNNSWSANKVFKLQFLESGATGVLGDRFAVVALMTALKIFHHEVVMHMVAASVA
ncbi:uncharacterized protein GGS25DRAFT_419057 [Hypoxylon fragiforme]|uniref:uncharacterized protein n=1 Tax=Hypoxylon fragiforme TaxID=63214 RepID=UPI0020C5B54E|nr:uncharacterized protein GGS25DRAFT_419057 [Hypoxylon fragiforme]KAI2605181.1 hypothetical protein GGS25DRAFT_419057 [Hypoxylon fragiforme]